MSGGARRKLRVARWEKEYKIPWYKKWYYNWLVKRATSEETGRKLAETMIKRHSRAKQKQAKALASGSKETARRYGRKAMEVDKEAEYVKRQLKEEAESIRGRFLADVLDLAVRLNDKEADRLASELVKVIQDEEAGRIPAEEADRRIAELSEKLVERASVVYAKKKGRS